MANFENGFDYLNWRHLAGAVLDVFHENQMNEENPGAIKASADIWCSNEELRQQMWKKAQHYWCVRSGYNRWPDGFTYFPLSVDAVVRMYFRIRKRKQEEVDGFDREVNS